MHRLLSFLLAASLAPAAVRGIEVAERASVAAGYEAITAASTLV